MPAAHWDVEVGGEDHVVTVERAETGKDVIRVDGRVAAKPLGLDEAERAINIGGMPYVLKREGDGFDLVVDKDGAAGVAARARSLETAKIALARANVPLPLERDSSVFRVRNLLFAIAVLAIGITLWNLARDHTAALAEQRVGMILTDAANGKGVTALAICLWAKNRRTLDTQEFSWASDHFDRWRREKDLERSFTDFKVVSSEVVKGAPVPTAIVTFTIEGKTYKVRVPKDQPISWEE